MNRSFRLAIERMLKPDAATKALRAEREVNKSHPVRSGSSTVRAPAAVDAGAGAATGAASAIAATGVVASVAAAAVVTVAAAAGTRTALAARNVVALEQLVLDTDATDFESVVVTTEIDLNDFAEEVADCVTEPPANSNCMEHRPFLGACSDPAHLARRSSPGVNCLVKGA